MFVQIEKDRLLESLSKLVPITERKSPLAILSSVLADATESELVLTAMDMQVGLRIKIPCEGQNNGKLAMPARKFYEIARELEAGVIAVQLEESGMVRIEAGQSVFRLSVLDGTDFPVWPLAEDIEMVTIPVSGLLNLVEKTVFAASTDESRISINSVLFENSETVTKVVAADGHRLAVISEDIGLCLDSRKLIPRRNLVDVRRILEGLKGDISVGFDKKNMILITDDLSMTARLVDADYPNYSAKIPKQIDKVIVADRHNLIQTLKRVAILTSDRNKGVTLDFNPGQLEIAASHPDLGTARDAISVEYDGIPFSTVANAAYLLEALNAVVTTIVKFEFSPANTPIMIRPEGEASYFSLVMPMKSKEND